MQHHIIVVVRIHLHTSLGTNIFQIFENRLYEPNLMPACGAIDVKAALKPIFKKA